MTTPFPEDREHAAYDRDAVERFWRVLEWTDGVLEEFAGWYCGKESPVHLFWHSLRPRADPFGGARAPALPDADPVSREAYSHEVVSFGFWAGDQNVREPSFYSYTAPEPADLRQPTVARQRKHSGPSCGSGSLALLPYEAVRLVADSRAMLLAFLESAYQAGADASGWDRGDARVELVSESAAAERPPGTPGRGANLGRSRACSYDEGSLTAMSFVSRGFPRPAARGTRASACLPAST